MPSLVNLKTRLSSVSSTQKVIKAMELVASAKIKKARNKAKEIDFFQQMILDSMSELQGYLQFNDFLKKNQNGQDIYLIITSDMGLCGAYNANVLKFYMNEINNKEKTAYQTLVLGSKGVKKLDYENIDILKKIVNYGNQDELDVATDIAGEIKKKITKGEVRSIKIIYTNYLNPLLQEVEMIDLLDATLYKTETKKLKAIEIEPSSKEVFEELFSQYALGAIYGALLKSLASEHSYRRNSMDSANTNSLELIEKLNLELNRARQSAITQEISEIIGGSESSKKE